MNSEIKNGRISDMSEIIHVKAAEIPAKGRDGHPGYKYFKKFLVSKGESEHCAVSLYEVPPGNAAYPYHYHKNNEESFYILSGKGLLKTPSGNKEVAAGDFIFFPANENGAHKLTNISETEPLVYLDFDTQNDVDITFYPDSGKVAIWGKDVDKVFRENENVEYYDGE